MAQEQNIIFTSEGCVKYKKADGVLTLVSNQMKWTANSGNSPACLWPYSDIKVQRISPETSSKVQLQIVLYDGSTHNFHFSHNKGRQAQAEERNKFKQHLAQLIPTHRKLANKELEQKNKLLRENPDVYQLYKDLVVGEIITAEEFWQNRNSSAAEDSVTSSQSLGISSGFLAEIRPDMHGCNELRFNLTADSIEAIFTTYPAVKAKYEAMVPCQTSEKEFWTEFFHSQHFHRDRVGPSKSAGKDIFADCAVQDEKEQLKKDLEFQNGELLVLSSQSSLNEEGYGTPSRSFGNTAGNPLVRRFNHQSTMVVKATSKRPTTSLPSTSAAKKTALRHSVEMVEFETTPEVEVKQLTVANVDKFTPIANGVDAAPVVTMSSDRYQELASCVSSWNPNLSKAMSTLDGCKAVENISPADGGRLHLANEGVGNISKDMKLKLQQHYRSLAELLRHFWLCFPITTAALEDKVGRMASSLEKYRDAKLLTFKQSLPHDQSSSHLDDAIDVALEKYSKWQSKRSSVKGTPIGSR